MFNITLKRFKSDFFALCLLSICMLTGLSGCGGETGPKKYSVSGKVTFNGEPVPSGEILFRPEEGQGNRDAGRILDGAYEIESLPGNKVVEITAYRESKTKFDESNPGERTPIQEQYIPENYNQKSELKFEVKKSGLDSIDFDLKN
ncbi:hypothetical protein [uncultured Gimesia sp.]|uniref:hypothetical protein n=1 Tax=uncultured Gimesia sp. TaxID=1678688 RepID=UPI0030DB9F2E|tara:strand:- start:339002 stop:339439 length:438 start_codon:yes stop_codon:yes gene_type:complete